MVFLKTHKNFISRALCLVLILAALMGYQSHARTWAAEVEEREAEIAEIEAWNREVLAAKEGTAEYEDGTYEGSGIGFGGEIRVEGHPEADKPEIYAESTFQEIADYCKHHNIRLSQYVFEREDPDFRQDLLDSITKIGSLF